MSGNFRALVSLFLLLAFPALALEGLEKGESAVVAKVVDGDTVVLEHAIDGVLAVRLVGIQAPKLPLGRPGFTAWPLAEEAKRGLAALVAGRRLTLSFGGRRKDRHGRLLAHLHDRDGVWIQGEMLRLGLARVYSFADNRAAVAEMLEREHQARAAGLGIWDSPYYAIRAPAEAVGDIGTFQIVEGRVLDAANVKGRVYLNFGLDWRSDFTVTIAAKARKLFASNGIDLLALKRRRLRARGWLKQRNGPMIEASHPEQIEILAD